MFDCERSGNKRRGQRGSVYGHQRTQRCHGNGERIGVKADNHERNNMGRTEIACFVDLRLYLLCLTVVDNNMVC